MSLRLSQVLVFAFLVAATSAMAQIGGPPLPNPRDLLQLAKEASGGKAWDALRSQHSTVTIQAAGLTGTAERWSDTTSGRSRLDYSIGPLQGATGFDGKTAWTQNEAGVSRAEADPAAVELAVNASFRDRLAFWYPDRGAALVSYKERANAEGADFDVIRITPEGGRPFELWINVETRLIERLVEREAEALRTEIYMDLREVQGVKIPYRVRASREDPRQDEIVVVNAMQFNRPLTGIAFTQPPPPKPDFALPAGRAAVSVPIDVVDGHLFVRVSIDGKGPLRMLLDSSSLNVLLPDVARTLQLKPEPANAGGGADSVGVVRAERMDIGGVVIDKPVFATLDLKAFLRRVEGMDDVAGVIGFKIFKRLPATVDYARRELTLHDPATFKYAGKGAGVPLTFRGTMPQVQGSIDGFAGVFDIGTGARGSLTLTASFATTHDLARKYAAKQSVIAGSGMRGPVRGLLARANELDVGGVKIEKPVTVLATDAPGTEPVAESGTAPGSADAGSIGFGVLRRFTPTFDYARGLVYLEPAAAMAETDRFERAGLWLERGPTGFVVVDVVAEGPAAAAGIKVGDVVSAINGKAASATTLAAARASLRGAAGSKVRLQLGPTGERTLVLRDLI